MMKRSINSVILLISLFFVSATNGASNSDDECVYTMYVKTGSTIKAGTDSKISVIIGDAKGRSVNIQNLEAWGGTMGPNYDYFEWGNLDVFTGRGPCIDRPVCSMNVTSDGSGLHHGWYCDYIEVTSTGPHKRCSQSIFHVEQWLANDAPPYRLSAYLNGCAKKPLGILRNGPFVVRNNKYVIQEVVA
ncbi:hypothetical protein MKX01_042050 [Papaver californicum]|nr:hypothetical protein MKX01_042050 [Papaver californicum]